MQFFKNFLLKRFFSFKLYLLFLKYHHKINVILEVDESFLVTDSIISFYVSRKERLAKYRYGIMNRINKVQSDYLSDLELNIPLDEAIIDVGANIGEFSYKYDKLGYKIFCFEPEILEYNCLKKNLPNCFAFNIGLWKEKTTLTLYSKNKSGDSSLFEINNYDTKFNIEVSTLDLEIPNNTNIGLLKIEAEGAEPEIILGAKKHIKNSRYIVVDVGLERGLKSESTLVDVINLLLPTHDLISYNYKRQSICFINRKMTL